MLQWILLAAITGVTVAFGNGINKYLLNNNMKIIPILWIKSIFYFVLVSLAIIYYYASHNEFKSFKKCVFDQCELPQGNVIFISFIATLLFLITNILFIKSTQLSPNIGYSSAISNAVSIIAVFFISMIAFKGHFRPETLLGLILIIAGVFLIKQFSEKTSK